MSLLKPAINEDLTVSLAQWPGQDKHAGHVVQFYKEDSALLDGLGRFIGTALGAGDGAIVIATKEHREGLQRRLKARTLDTAAAARQGRFICIDAAETLAKFIVDGWPDAGRFAETIGEPLQRARKAAEGENPRIAAFGEMVALLWQEGKHEAAIALEQLWNNLAGSHEFMLLCAYPMECFSHGEHAQPFLKVCAEHSGVIPMESYTSLTSEEERLRSIAHLQQKAHALDTETAVRKRIEKSLQRRESELADLLENAVAGAQQLSADGKVLWANRALLKLLGCSASDYEGREFAEFFVDKQNFAEFWGKLLRREEIYNFAADLQCNDGDVRHVLIHSNGLWEEGRLVHARCFVHDVTENKKMELALQRAYEEMETRVEQRTAELARKNRQVLKQAEILKMRNEDLCELSARLLQAQDEERRRIARDLHDSTGQTLALLSMNLAALEMKTEKASPAIASAIAENSQIVREISSELRTLSYLLHPPLLDEMGLGAALRWYAQGFGQRSGIKVALELPSEIGRLPRSLETAIFRVVQECLINVHRHSGSATACIRLSRTAEKLTLEVQDEGRGIDRDKLARITSFGAPGVGLRGMRERVKDFGGDLEIVSPEKGTLVKLAVPLGTTSLEPPDSDAKNRA